jgi:predicted acylesterase/phospholipase RssA
MPIKYLIISGGGPTCLKALGSLQYLEEHKFWNIDNIEKIYGTSGGALIAVLLAMKFDWLSITDYFIKRRWHEVYSFNINQVFESFSKKGLYNKDVFEIFYKPFFLARDISMTITMKEFYEYSKIELHFFTLEINEFIVEDLSYKTHPNLLLLDALHMSSALPIIISPVCSNNKCYVDGGVISNYPLNFCLKQNDNIDEMLGFRNDYEKKENSVGVTNESTIFDYIITFINKVMRTVDTQTLQQTIPNEVRNKTQSLDLTYIKNTISSVDIRKQLLDEGRNAAKEFLSSIVINKDIQIVVNESDTDSTDCVDSANSTSNNDKI